MNNDEAKIKLPLKKGNPNTEPEIEFKQLVIIGANGSGKTRFGSKIEETYPEKVHRISAQKSLVFPSEVSPVSKNSAEKQLFFGTYHNNWNDDLYIQQKAQTRWTSNINTSLLDDFNKLLVFLHTEEYEESLNYKEGKISKPTTKLDIIQSVWEDVMPHRKLIKRAGVIETYPTGQEASKYNASEMSDGERVIFYLIGQTLCIPENSILIIDEPEMHIHKSLVKKLFDKIENERPDCSYIYLTHDIDFAFSRQNAKKIWAKYYLGSNVWDYEILENSTPIPEQLYLDILGSRTPVIFIEGNNSSIDYQLYEQVYTDYTLKPLGGCEEVIQSVQLFNNKNEFHNIESFGIIDRDRRKEDAITTLNEKNIWVLAVAEAENILLIEDIVKAVAEHMGKNADDVFTKVKQNIICFFKARLDSQVLIHYREIIKNEMDSASKFKKKEISEVIAEIETNIGGIKMQEIFDEIKTEFEEIIGNSDYDEILRVFNLKDALIPNSKICELTSVRCPKEYLNLVLTLLKKKDAVSEKISTSIKNIIKGSPLT